MIDVLSIIFALVSFMFSSYKSRLFFRELIMGVMSFDQDGAEQKNA
jgi:hypothetical protein